MRRSLLGSALGAVLLPLAALGGTATANASADTYDPVISAAGDVACKPGSNVTATTCRQQATAALLAGSDHVLTLGDNQYDNGTLKEFLGSYDMSWGHQKPITSPVPGNHEYGTSGASGYFSYFGAAAGVSGRGWYSYNVGAWHLIALNSSLPMNQGSAQNEWLEADLNEHPAVCTLAYYHYPLYAAGSYAPGMPKSRPVWVDLLRAHADLVLNGHEHLYERFAPMDEAGHLSATGIREIVVGTGGMSHSTTTADTAGLRFLDRTHFGVLRLTLHPTSYNWAFTGENGAVLDSGTAACAT